MHELFIVLNIHMAMIINIILITVDDIVTIAIQLMNINFGRGSRTSLVDPASAATKFYRTGNLNTLLYSY